MGIETAILALTAISTAAGIYQGVSAAGAQSDAQQQAKKQGEASLLQSQQAMNRANAKHPDVNAILSAAQQAGKSGESGTMLTGPQGVAPGSLPLGKSTLLGS